MKQAKGINKYIGLVFKSKRTEGLLFEFEKPVNFSIHSLFVFFNFKAIWTFEDGTKEERIIGPFSGLWKGIKPNKSFIKLEEIPL